MRFATPPTHAGPLRQLGAEVALLCIEAAERVLQIRKAGPVLDVEERATLDGADRDIPTPGELEMLKRLVQAHLEAEPTEMRRFRFPHRGVDRIRRAPGQRLASPRIRKLELCA